MKTQVATAHVTEIGLCVHDWSLVPCAVHGDCAGCVEHIVEKGNAKQKTEAERQLDEVEKLLARAEAEDTEGTSRWVAAHRRRRDGLLAVFGSSQRRFHPRRHHGAPERSKGRAVARGVASASHARAHHVVFRYLVPFGRGDVGNDVI